MATRQHDRADAAGQCAQRIDARADASGAMQGSQQEEDAGHGHRHALEDTQRTRRQIEGELQHDDEFYKRLVNSVDGLSNVTSTFAMEPLKYTTALPL